MGAPSRKRRPRLGVHYWPKPGTGWAILVAALAPLGLEIAQTLSIIERGEVTRTYRVDLARTNTADPYSPVEIRNSLLVLTVCWLPQADRYEVLAYVS